ncbi:MAG: dephospho-CoA kinase [Thermomicrobiaceae bacterium]
MTEPDGPYLLGITGNIACGKSLVSSILAELGAEVIDADHVVHELMQPGSEILQEIARRFGDDVLNPDGSLNRPRLGEIVFGDSAALADLEQITHSPAVQTILSRSQKSSAPVVVIDAIKLYESGLADHCQQTWTVYCNPEVQRQRLMDRNNFSKAQAQQRIDAQPPQDEKKRRADVVIDNSSGIPETRAQVMRAWEQIVPDKR